MADLHSLIRLRQYRVEEKQKLLADLFREAERFEVNIRSLQQQSEKERKLAEQAGDFETLTAYTHYAGRVRDEIESLEAGLAKVNARVAVAQDAMREAFGELKKIEIIQKNRDLQALRDELKREGQVLDEVGIEGFRRKGEAGEK